MENSLQKIIRSQIESGELNTQEQVITFEQVLSKSRSSYSQLELTDELEEESSGKDHTKIFNRNREILKDILNDEETLAEIYAIGNRPDASCVSEEFQNYLAKFPQFEEKYGISPWEFESLSSYDYFRSNSLVKRKPIVSVLQEIHKARNATEEMIKTELLARRDMANNNPEIAEFLDQINIYYSHPDHLGLSIQRSKQGDYTILLNPKDFDFNEKSAKPTLKDRLAIAHEIYHAIFDEMLLPESEGDIYLQKEAVASSFLSLTEGFATIMELHLNKSMQVNPTEYNLSEEEVIELESIQQDRIRYLKNRVEENVDLQYWEGVSNIFHKIIKEGGVKGVIEFCKKLDLEKAMKMDRESQEYIELLEKSDPDTWIEHLGRK